jgi:hypothetical protein
MIENPDDAAEWLREATGVEAIGIRTPWRPTRTLRGLIGFLHEEAAEAFGSARARLSDMPARRVNESFQAPYATLVNLQGAWAEFDLSDYALLRLPTLGSLIAHRERRDGGWSWGVEVEGFVNRTIEALTSHLASRGERVLGFLPRSKHYPFAVAENVDAEIAPVEGTADAVLVQAYLRLANAELGVLSPLAELLQRRVTVHSSALVDAERVASEEAYQRGIAQTMLATGTLAQGLNFPATAVLVGGMQVGYTANAGAIDEQQRTRAQLLNAIGRAGRAGVANHGLALVVPDRPIFFGDDSDPRAAVERAPILMYEDASIRFDSQLTSLIENALQGVLVREAMSVEELAAYTYLPAEPADDLAARILERSYGVWRVGGASPATTSRAVVTSLETLGQQFLAEAGAPQWTTEIAYRSGLTLPQVFALERSIREEAEQDIPAGSIPEWFDFLSRCLRRMPRQDVRDLLDANARESRLRFESVWGPQTPTSEAWDTFTEAIRRFMGGQPVASIAAYALELPNEVDNGRTAGTKPIPKTILFLQGMAYRLSLLAGTMTATWSVAQEQAEEEEIWNLSEQQRRALDVLPLALRCGCSDESSLAWYRFGCRYRVPAHLLARHFRVPPGLSTEGEIRQWVVGERRAWLDGNRQDPEEDPTLIDAIQRVIRYETARV